MSLILRVDVDKPYGRHTLLRKIFSKIKEDYFTEFPVKIGYLSHLKQFIEFCNKNKVQGHFYHRICTAPDIETLALQAEGKHIVGLHLENSRSKETLKAEVDKLQQKVNGITINSFSKHGSGTYKLGKHHYPAYEPQNYKRWADELELKYPSGNGTAEKAEDLYALDGYYENLFWIEPYYRSSKFNRLEDVVAAAKNSDVVVLIHPCNYLADKQTKDDFERLVEIAKKEGIEWRLFESGK
ncbi:hypothetical protein QQ054_19945 [Oscillatoria amoena NRMC-F 0135]|nr:hypothetical protein [Oscillatoria amoena NRMC-F 0135]